MSKDTSRINVTPITAPELKEILGSAYDRRASLFIWGPPGIGKSTIIKSFAKEKEFDLVDIRLTTLEPSDLRGLPHFDLENRRTTWYLPEFVPTSNKPTVIFLDELPAADARLQASAYELVLDRAIGGKPLPEKCWVCAAGNEVSDGAISFGMGSALADRFQHVRLNADVKSWLAWGKDSGVHPAVLAFLKVKSDYLECGKDFLEKEEMIVATPRSWERVSDVIKYHETKGTKLHEKKTIEIEVQGYIGRRVSTEFFGILREIQDLPEIAQLLKSKPDQQLKMIPDSINAMYGLVYSVIAYLNTQEDFVAGIKLFDNLASVTKTNVPRSEIQSLFMELMFEKATKHQLLGKLMTVPEMQKYYKKIQKIVSY